ncbi:MAG: isopentenyl-diphosphate Delta-isomerase [Hyphomicrobiales bacterium]|nr:MAG: isopentenyl-diphosphate Delta-isomerase [Hyphomicrobiales bacterium]
MIAAQGAGPDEERVILVDDADRPLGTEGKLAAHRKNLRHRAVSVLVFDRAGRMLLQRRAAQKYHSPGLWSNACCTHPRPGEAAAGAASRRLAEEMGIAPPLVFAGLFAYEAPVGDGLWENEIVHVFTGIHDGAAASDPAPDPAEVGDWRWMEGAALRADVAARGHLYTPWFRLYAEAPWFAGPAFAA